MEIRGDYGTFKDIYLGTLFFPVLGLSRFLFLLTISPHFEKIRSDGTEDAGVHKNLFASLYKFV